MPYKKDDPPNQPSSARINYAITECNNKVYFYGGLDEKNQILGSMDVFDACTYKFSTMKYRGDGFKPKGRQGASAIALNKYTIVFIGGSYENSLIEQEPVPANESVLIFDTESTYWKEIPAKNSPTNLVFCSPFKLDN